VSLASLAGEATRPTAIIEAEPADTFDGGVRNPDTPIGSAEQLCQALTQRLLVSSVTLVMASWTFLLASSVFFC
jgi:hypothetical protein